MRRATTATPGDLGEAGEPSRCWRRLMARAGTVMLMAACSEEGLPGPDLGSLEVTSITTTTGAEDPNGFLIAVNHGNKLGIEADGTLLITGLTPGDYLVELTGLPSGCSVAGSNPRMVAVSPGQTAKTAFQVDCVFMGILEVMTVTTGLGVDPDGYLIRVDQTDEEAIGMNATLGLTLASGEHQVELDGVASNCSVAGNNPRPVTVTANQTVAASFQITCAAVELPRSLIAFQTDRDGNPEIYVMDADGSVPTRLTGHPLYDGVPAISPDGSRILFETGRVGNNEIFVMNLDGSDPINLTNHTAWDERPSWSPDGTRILFVSDRDGNPDIFVMNADGSNPVNLTNHPDIDRPAHWSPDGASIAFATDRTGDFEIFVMNPDGSNPVNLTKAPEQVDFAPAWSPDGRWIAYTSRGIHENTTDVIRMNADGSQQINLTEHAADDRWPSWSPDGEWIVFSTDRTGYYEVFVMKADGSGPVNRSQSPGSVDVAGWPQGWRQLNGIAAEQQPVGAPDRSVRARPGNRQG